MATKDSIMKQSIFFWVFGHRLSFEYGLKKFLLGAWRNLSGALRELILRINYVRCKFPIYHIIIIIGLCLRCLRTTKAQCLCYLLIEKKYT